MLGNLGRHKLNFSLSYTVGWSDYCDFNFLQFSKMAHCCRLAIFYEFNSNVSAEREKKKNFGNIFLYFIFCLQNGQNCFELVKQIFFVMFLGFRITVQAKFAEALRRVKKQQIKLKFWIWGPITVYCTTVQHDMWPNFCFEKITPPYHTVYMLHCIGNQQSEDIDSDITKIIKVVSAICTQIQILNNTFTFP